MICRIKIIILSLLVTAFSASAQTQPLGPLKVGDRMPDVLIKRLMNYSSSSVRVKDLRGKAIILDFCNVSCSNCTENMPYLMNLKNQFHGRLEVIRITRNSEQKMKGLYSRSVIAAKSNLPVAVSDTIFSTLFPIQIPHHAWIDASGFVRAITDYRNATPENIRILIEGGAVNVTPVAYLDSFNSSKPIFLENGVNVDKHVRQYSVVTSYVNGIGDKTGFSMDPVTKKIYRRAFYNMPLPLLLKLAYGGFEDNQFGILSDYRRVILEVKDTARFVRPDDPSRVVPWEWQNTWCYEIQVNPNNVSQLPLMMQADLCNYFNIDIKVEKRRTSGFALVKTGKGETLHTKGGRPRKSFNTITRQNIGVNQNVGQLVRTLSNMLPDLVVDETGLASNIDYSVPNTNDPSVVRQYLRENGLDLVNKVIKVEMLVVRDRT